MSIATLLAPIQPDMLAINDVIRRRLASEVSLINDISGYIIHAGGKRLRPALTLLVARALNATDLDKAHTLAAVVEFIHTATLLHDDVVDTSELRRGRATANHQFGNAAAVLAGDFLYSRAFQMMVDADLPAVMRVMADATNAISEGEVLQLLNAHNPDTSEAAYTRVIELKTARLFEAAAALGALTAASPLQAQAVAYARHLGLAYQMIDDVIDLTGNPEETGKALGNDLAEGKPTLPMIRALEQCQPDTRAVLAQALKDGDVSAFPLMLSAIQASDGLAYTQAQAQQHADQAVQALAAFPDSPFKQALAGLAGFVVQRRS
jgi:octaprenyl-diphosphate synthase